MYGERVATGQQKPSGVIPSLMDILSKAVRDAKMDQVDLRPLTRGLGQRGGPLSEKQLRRYLEGAPPPGSKIDEWTRIVAAAVGEEEPYAYWARALKKAKAGDSGEPGGEKIHRPRK
jgi:hypothetical protein